MKPDPAALSREAAAVAGSAQPGPDGPRAGLAARGLRAAGQLAALAFLAILYLGAASLLAIAVVRVGADLMAGIDPFLPAHRRPFLGVVALARRALAVDILRQVFLAGLVCATLRWRDPAGWRARLALGGPRTAPLRPGPLLLVLLCWPALHIAWVGFTAALFGQSFGQGTRLSPLLSPLAAAAWLAYAVVLAPAAEEMLIRGALFARARAHLGPAASILATALIFALAHAAPQGGGWSLARPVSLLPLALVLGWLRWRTGRLWPCIALHGWSNLALLAYVLWPTSGPA